MSEEKSKSKRPALKHKSETRRSRQKTQKSGSGMKKPKSPFIHFCIKVRNENKNLKKDKKLTAKDLGALWKSLTEDEKKPFINAYEKEKAEYEKNISELIEEEKADESEDEKEQKKPRAKQPKAKARTRKSQMSKNNRKDCNCGKCDACLKSKKNKSRQKEIISDVDSGED